jgi:hypothetical protein
MSELTPNFLPSIAATSLVIITCKGMVIKAIFSKNQQNQ